MSIPDEPPSAMFMRILRVPQAVADALVAAQVTSLEEVAYIPQSELLSIASVERWVLLDLRERARLYLLEQ